MAVELTDGIKWYLAFVFSTVVHEAAHAWTAQKLGDDTAARGGQVTLDPTPHIRREPFGMVVVPILSFLSGGWMIGWASAPYNREWAFRYPRRAGAMAIAGPLANISLLLIAAVILSVGVATGFFERSEHVSFMNVVQAGPSGISYFAARLLSIFFSLNLLLACFNLLPLPPLDGASAPLLFLPESAARAWMQFTSIPALRTLGIFIAWNCFGQLFPPIQSALVHLIFPTPV